MHNTREDFQVPNVLPDEQLSVILNVNTEELTWDLTGKGIFETR